MRLNDCGHESGRGPARGFAAIRIAVGCVFAALALAGCGMSDGYGTLLVDPARYSAYHCNDLVKQQATLQKREHELRDLIDRASDGSGGGAIAAMAYRTDYESVLTQEKLLQRAAADKNCELVQTYRSDQTVR
jgi:hypothetical protein